MFNRFSYLADLFKRKTTRFDHFSMHLDSFVLLELQSYENQWKKHLRTSAENHLTVPTVSKQGKKSSPNDGLFSHTHTQKKIFRFVS